MSPDPPQHARINLAELKVQLAKKLGPERAQRYFGYLNRLLRQRLSKPEFDKLCLATLGPENIPLHNQLIRSIFWNAGQAKAPPPPAFCNRDALKPNGAVGHVSPSTDERLCPSLPSNHTPPIWSNGDILPQSPRKVRSGVRDRKLRDRPSPLGPNGKIDIASHQSLLHSNDGAVVRENGSLNTCDLKRPVQHSQATLAEHPTKRPRTEKSSPQDQVSVYSKSPLDVVVVEDGEEMPTEDVNSIRGLLRAPLGIPFCHASVGGARRSLPLATSTSSSCLTKSCYNGELCHTEALRKRMEQIATAQGLGGITMDCANLLNNGLDVYLKRLIRSCIELVRARLGHGSIKHHFYKNQPQGKIINGIWPGNHMHVQRSGQSLEDTQELKNPFLLSLLDFRVAMELNPQQLGEDWSLLLEKLCLHSFEE